MKTTHYKILSISLKGLFIVALGYLLLIVTYQLCSGPDRYIDAGNDYVIGDLPGHLYYMPHGKPRAMVLLPDEEEVDGFFVRGKWIVGKTKNRWFAVDKKAHHIYCSPPLTSEEKEKLQVLAEFMDAQYGSGGHHIYYPIASDELASEKEVKNITGLDFSSSNLMTEFRNLSFWWPSPYEYKYPAATKLVGIVGTGYVIIVFLVIMLRRTLRGR